MKHAIAIFCIGLIGYACSNGNSPPEDLLAEATYVDLLIELQLAESYYTQIKADSTAADSMRRVIFEKYDLSQEQFRTSHQYYQQDIEGQRERISTAIENLRKDRLAAQDSTSVSDSTGSN